MEKKYKIHRNAKANRCFLQIGIAKKISKYFRNKKRIKTCNLMSCNTNCESNKKQFNIFPVSRRTHNHHSTIPSIQKSNKTFPQIAVLSASQHTANSPNETNETVPQHTVNFPTATNEINPPQKWYHFIGIGGISMSALANLLSYEKNKITG
ncbi:MAG: hypothetical protein PHH71_03420, partial [Clostridia bacterium]|nr:hypothetical protein [Clostridia bacterium]MDD4408922.1 hypothetical protein [Clostridia bacterium]